MKLRIMLVLLALAAPTVVSALGLGKLELQSTLNQPFKARVELLSATADELDSLKVSLAGQEAFDRAGIQRTFLLTQLQFRVQETEKGPDYIQIRSSETIREPFLNFLLEINWSKGRLFREYTVLLDPPTYIAPSSRKKAIIHPETPAVGIDSGDHQVVYDLEYKPESKSRVSEPAQVTPSSYDEPTTISYSGSGDYGPAVTGDTLWSIAKAARPDSSVSINQMMLAILNANPEAFIENNINGLKRGAILQIPDATAVDSLDQSDALAQAISQHALWDEYKGHIASSVSQQADGAAYTGVTEEPGDVEQEPSVTDIEETGEAQLRLISESEQGLGSDQTSADSTGVDVDALNNELALANESIEALFLENAELKDKLTETEGIIDDLKRLIVLKEDELAAMQEQIMIAAAEQESAEAIIDETIAEEEFVEEIEEAADDELVEEDIDEEMEAEVADSEDAVEEEIVEEEIVMDVTPVADGGGFSELLGMVMGLLEKAKANLMIIGGAVGGLLLLVFLMIFVSKRRSAKATVIDLPADEFPDFGEDYVDETVKADALSEDDSESVTAIPGSEDETILPGDDSESAADSFEIPEESVPEIPEETSSASAEEPEEDPMEEVNVFLAYEHFDEAESFVRQALEKEPENLDFHSKLLEVFYAASNKKSYEEAAKVVHEKTGGQGKYWDMATVMWQEISPNRALFETPTEGEEEEGAEESISSGVLNIAAEGDESSDTGDMDLKVDGESGEDMLDVTAAADIDSIPSELVDSGSSDLDFSLDNDDTMGLSADESNELLDDTIQMQPSDVHQVQQAQEDVAEEVLDITTEMDSEKGISESSEEDILDISIAQESGDADELDLSLGDSVDELDISLEDSSGEEAISLDDSVDSESATSGDVLDISIDDTSSEEEEDLLDVTSAMDIKSEDEDILDVSIVQESGDADELDLSLGDSVDELDISLEDSSGDEAISLDDSVDNELDLSLGDSVDELDMSLEDSSGDEAISLDDSVESEMTQKLDKDKLDFSLLDSAVDDKDESDDLLDVTSKIDFEYEGEEDLLDVTTAASADIDSGDLMEPKISDDETGLDSSELDASEDVDGLDMNIPELEMEAGDDSDDGSLDMESTVQMPPAKLDSLSMADDDEDDDDDKTFLVPKSSNVDEQTEDEEMASQLDLAKAYIELGDNENAKTILDEVISQGSEVYRKQAEELIGQIK